MPYEKQISPENEAQLDALANVLVLPREMAIDVGTQFRWEPADGSGAVADLAATINPDLDAEKNTGWASFPRSVCSLHLRGGTEYLAGIATLLRAREVHQNPGTLARSAFECAMRGFVVIDGRVTTRERVARALLDDLAGAERHRAATKHLAGKGSESFKLADRRWKFVRETVKTIFGDEANIADDVSKWRVAQQSYPRLNEVARSWAIWRASRGGIGLTEDEAEGIYDFLCLETHPQSFASHQHATWEEDAQGLYVTDIETIARLILVALVAVLDLAELLYAYHGWDIHELAAIGQAADALWPKGTSEPSPAP